MRRLVCAAAVSILVAVGAGACGTDERFLPAGEFAGSTPSDRPVKLSISDKPLIDGQPAEWVGRGSMREKKDNKIDKDGVRSLVDCVVRDEGEELSCTFSAIGRDDIPKTTIELVRI